MLDFQTICDRVSAESAARRYGMEINRHGRALCPFHDDTHPSLSFKGNRFRCWACNSYGSAIDLVAGLFKLSVREAAEMIAADYGINGSDSSSLETARRISVAERRAAFEKWRVDTINRLNAICRRANTALREGNPESDAKAVRWLECAEYLSDELEDNNPETIERMYRERHSLETWIQSI